MKLFLTFLLAGICFATEESHVKHQKHHHKRSINYSGTCRELGHEGCCKVTVENKGAYILDVSAVAACCKPGEDLMVTVEQCAPFSLTAGRTQILYVKASARNPRTFELHAEAGNTVSVDVTASGKVTCWGTTLIGFGCDFQYDTYSGSGTRSGTRGGDYRDY